MNKLSRLVLVGVVILLNACATHPQKNTAPSTLNKPAETQDQPSTIAVLQNDDTLMSSAAVFAFIANFKELSADEQKKQWLQLTQVHGQDKSDLNTRLKIAIIYALPSSRLHDNSKAQPLLEDLLREKDLDDQNRALVAMLRDYTAENSRLSQKVRDEQKHVDTLQVQLDNLKTIEKTMVNRDLQFNKN